jgi:3-oxoacyl-[acyl-carrier-protein] synthase-3
MPAFGGGLTFCAHLVRWGERVKPLGTTTADLQPPTRSALEIVESYRKARGHALA